MNKKFFFIFLFFVLVLTSCTTSGTDTAIKQEEAEIDSCLFEPKTTMSPPGDLYGKEALANAQWSDENFTFDFWLYCDSSLHPDGVGKTYSAIPSLGMFAHWNYTGAKIDGHNADYWGFEPEIYMANSWDGPLYKASSKLITGLSLDEQVAQNNIESKVPFQYHIGVESTLGRYEVVFSFIIEKDKGIYITPDITVQQVSP